MLLKKWLLCFPTQLASWIIRLPKRTARWLLANSIVFVLNRPGLKLRAMVFLRNYPKLEMKLRRLALVSRPSAAQSASPITLVQLAGKLVGPNPTVNDNNVIPTSTVEVSQLSPDARRIYKELKTAMAQHEQEMQ